MDYDALATQFGGSVEKSKSVDYDALATSLGGSTKDETTPTSTSTSLLDTLKDVGLGTIDAAIPLIGGPLGWLAETGTKWGTAGLGHIGNLLAQVSGDRYGLRATPEEILEASKMLANEQVGSKFYQPQTELGQQAVENVGKVLETVLAPARWAGDELRRRGYPTLGELTQDVGELGEFAALGGVGSKVGGMLEKPIPKANFPTEEPPVKSSTKPLLDTVAEVDKLAKIKEAPLIVAKTPTNQTVVDVLKEKLATIDGDSPKAGYQRGFYSKVIKTIAELDKGLGEVDLSTLPGLKDPKGKTRQLIEEVLATRTEPAKKEVETSLEVIGPVKDPVTFIGIQENPKGEPLTLVNESSGTTKVYDPAKHDITNPEEFREALKGKEEEKEVTGDAQSLRENEGQVSGGGIEQKGGTEEGSKDLQLESKEEGPATRGKEGAQVEEERVISEFDTPTLAREEGYTLDSRSFSTEKSATTVATRLGPEWEVVKVGERFKAAKWVESEPTTKVESRVPESSSLEELAKTVEVGSDLMSKGLVKDVKEEIKKVQETQPKDYKTGTKEERDAALAAAMEKYKAAKAAKINEVRESKVEPGDLGVLLEEFQTFSSREVAIKLGKDPSRLVQDPLTKEWFEELKFDELEDLGWEQDRGDLNLKSDEISWSDDFEVRKGELSEGRVRDLWDILGNERGSGPPLVDPANLRPLVDKLKELMDQASKLGKGLEDYLVGLGISERVKNNILLLSSHIPEYEKQIETNLRKSLKPSKTEAPQVVKTFEDGLRDIVNSPKKAVKDYVNFLKSVDRIVDDYEVGSKKLPTRQVPWIEETVPEVRKGFEDIIGRTGESPHNVLHRAFEIQNNPSIDALESHMTQLRNTTNGLTWAKDILEGIPESKDLLQKELLPLYEKYGEQIKARNRKASRVDNLEFRIKGATNRKRIEKLTDELNKAKIDLTNYTSKLEPLAEAFDSKMTELAPKSSDIRIALHAGDALPEGITLTSKELEISSRVREYMDMAGKTLESLGIPIIKNRPYLPHIWKALIADEGALSFASRMKIPEIMSFLHQLPESRIWTPSVRMILENYIPMAERKIAYQPFLNKWAEFVNERSYPKLQSYMHDWIDANLYKKGESLLEKGANALISLEYARLIGLSLSVGFKHLMKLPQTWSRYDAITSLQAVRSEMKVPIQAVMKKLGVKGEYNELRLTQAFINQKDLIRSLDEMTALKQIVRSPNLVKRILSQPVVAVEAFDNGVSIMAAAIAGGKTGIRYRQVHNGLWQTILDANFRAGWDQPLWQKRTLVRAVTMFSSTPFKIAEYKMHMIERAIKGERDVFGTHYGTMLIRYAAIIGAAELVAQANDTTLMETFLHLPFFSTLKGLAIPPLVDWAVQTKNKGFVEGTRKHFSNWGALTKWMKINRTHYPSKMYDSPLKDLLGLHRKDWNPESNKERGGRLPSLPKGP